SFAYRSLGLVVDADREGVIHGWSLIFSDPLFPGFQPFAGRFISGGDTVPLAQWSEREIIEHFGPPRETDRDDTEIILFYDRGKYEWNFELSLDSRLECFLIFDARS